MAARGRGQRMSTAARSAPYARPQTDSRMTSRDAWEHDAYGDEPEPREAAQWPPEQITIRGASGPTWVTAGNLVLGTSVEDIQETFQQFGEITQVLRREPPGPNYPSCSFYVGFVQRSSAEAAIKTLDKALADGRLLSVQLKHTQPEPAQNRLLRAAGVDYQANGGANSNVAPAQAPVVSRPPPAIASPAPAAPSAPAPRAQAAPPTGPRHAFPAHPHAPHAQAHRPLPFSGPAAHGGARPNARALTKSGKFQAPGKGVPIAPASVPLQTRLLSVPELRAMQKKQAREKAGRPTHAAAPFGFVPAGPTAAASASGSGAKKNFAGANANGKGPQMQVPNGPRALAATGGAGSSNLMARLALPLEQRLLGAAAAEAGKGKAGKGGKGKGAQNAALLQVGSGAPPKSDLAALAALKAKREKRNARKKAARKAKSAASGSGGMELD